MTYPTLPQAVVIWKLALLMGCTSDIPLEPPLDTYLQPSVVHVISDCGCTWKKGAGVVTVRGVITARHVLCNETAKAQYWDGATFDTQVGWTGENDVAILTHELDLAVSGVDYSPSVLGEELCVVTRYQQEICGRVVRQYLEAHELSATLDFGDSGSPVFRGDRVVGIAIQKLNNGRVLVLEADGWR